MMKNLKELRKEIDTFDEKLLNLLNERAKRVLEIGKIKQKREKSF